MSHKDDITAMLDRWATAEAAGDADAISACLTDDFLGVGPLGFMLPRQAWLGRHGPNALEYEKFELQETLLREYGDTAVVTALVDQPGTHPGQPDPA